MTPIITLTEEQTKSAKHHTDRTVLHNTAYPHDINEGKLFVRKGRLAFSGSALATCRCCGVPSLKKIDLAWDEFATGTQYLHTEVKDIDVNAEPEERRPRKSSPPAKKTSKKGGGA